MPPVLAPILLIRRSTAAISLWLLLCLLAPGTAPAATVDPFIATVEVADRSEAARLAGFQQSLSRVLTKLTGRQNTGAVNAGDIDQLVQQFRYLEKAAEDEGSAVIELEVKFLPSPVRELARTAGLPIWPLERGETIVWIAVEENGQRNLLGTEPHHGPLRDAIVASAQARSLPVVLPLLDLEDRSAVNTSEIWGGFADRMRETSSRYGATHVLIGRIEPERGGFLGRWVLDIDRDAVRWETRGEDMAEVIDAGMAGAAQRLASRFAISGQTDAGAQPVRIEVLGVESPRAYGKLLSYLESLSLVDRVLVERVDGAAITLRLEMDGNRDQLDRVLQIDRVLQAEEAGFPPPPVPVYRIDAFGGQ